MTYVVFLRGINVGGRIIKMADLQKCLEKLGLKDVKTVLQSGNVIFESELPAKDLKQMVEAGLTEKFKYPAAVQVFSADQLKKIVEETPFKKDEADRHSYVIFFENGLEKELVHEAVDLNAVVEAVVAGEGVIYWSVPKGQTIKSTFSKYLSKSKYKAYNTNRNLRTLQKILALAK